MLSFSPKAQTHFGLDFSDASAKLVQLQKTGVSVVQAYSDILLPKEQVGAMNLNRKVLSEVVRQAINKPKYGHLTSSFVVASIPETKCFVRVIQIPKISDKEAQEAVPWEAEAYIPLPISQVYLDWVVLDRSNPGEKMTVLITAAPKDYVDNFVDVLEHAGLVPLALEVESSATARSLVAKIDEAVLIADIDTVRTSLVIYDKGVLQFTSSLPIAGNALTESIAKSLNINQEEAEALKKQIGISEEGGEEADNQAAVKIKRALTPVLSGLVEEIKNTIRFYEEHISGEKGKISRLLLTGGSSKLKHLPSFLHERFVHEPTPDHQLRSLPGLKVELGNPWVNILQKGQTPPLSREDSLSYATAIGLALREIE